MRRTASAMLILGVMLAACSKAPEQAPQNSVPPTENRVSNDQPAPALRPVSNEAAPSPRTSLPEPKGPIDPKSIEAAGQVVQHYGALIEEGRWAEARKLWGNAGAAAAFEKRIRGNWTTHLEIGNPRDEEGAAGSIYVTVPAIFYNDQESGEPSRLETDVILRRVNDVPGSTEAQRQWHIERIEAA